MSFIMVPYLSNSIFLVLDICHMLFSLFGKYFKKRKEKTVVALSMSLHGLPSGQVCVEAWGIYLKPVDLERVLPAVPPAPPVHVYLP